MQIASVLLLILNVFGYRKCNANIYPYQGRSVSVPLVPSATRSINVNNVTVAVQVKGTIRVLDGCTFEVSDLTLLGPKSSVWYGGNGTALDGVRLSEETISESQAGLNQTFTFIQTVGSWVAFEDFTQFRLFDVATLSLLATADLPSRSTNTSSTAQPNTGSGNSTTGTSPSPVTTSGSIRSFSPFTIAAIFVSLF